MKTKKQLFLSLVLVAIFAIGFAGCSKEESTELPNPMVQRASLEAIRADLGFTFETLPGSISDQTFFTIADTTAQTDFTDKGITYSARKAKNANENISGVYITFANEQTINNKKGNAVFYQYNDGLEGLATWSDTEFIYSLYCETSFDLTAMQSVVNTIS